HVEAPGPELAVLSVTDDVDAGAMLPRNDVSHAVAQQHIESLAVDGQAVLNGLDVLHEPGRTHKATHVRGGDPLKAVRHGACPPLAVSDSEGLTPVAATPVADWRQTGGSDAMRRRSR